LRLVSVDGDIYTLRSARSSTQRGALVLGETNELQVDLKKYFNYFVTWARVHQEGGLYGDMFPGWSQN